MIAAANIGKASKLFSWTQLARCRQPVNVDKYSLGHLLLYSAPPAFAKKANIYGINAANITHPYANFIATLPTIYFFNVNVEKFKPDIFNNFVKSSPILPDALVQ